MPAVWMAMNFDGNDNIITVSDANSLDLAKGVDLSTCGCAGLYYVQLLDAGGEVVE